MTVQRERISVPFKQAVQMLVPYCKSKIWEQITAVLPIVLYLIFFQSVVLGLSIAESGTIAVGIGLVVLGLAFFMEGLLLGIMPLGEILGIKLPLKSGIVVLIAFSFVLGFGATYAEPSIGILKASGSFIKPWDAPLLFVMLNQYSEYLVAFVGIGVGFSVVAGMMRFMKSISLKPFIYIVISITLLVSLWGVFDKNIFYITGLAWDCGAVTTGPVTVPLVLALGIGICRSVGGEDSGSMGFGVVTLASAFPILAVMLLGFALNTKVPEPMSKAEFFSEANKAAAVFVAGGEELYESLKSDTGDPADKVQQAINLLTVTTEKFVDAARAILPLTLLLLLVFIFILREKLPKKDEIFFGIFISIIGMGLFGIGMDFGLKKIGDQVGSRLPASFSAIEIREEGETIYNFDEKVVQTSIDESGQTSQFFFKNDKNMTYKAVPYHSENFDAKKKTYNYIPKIGPLFGENGGIGGVLVVILFAFIMGYGATLAEPALNALGMKAEELSVGTFKKATLIHSVAAGVGCGIALGVAKIIWNLPIIWMLVPAYVVLLFLTKISDEQFVNISWDSAGVTTGPITVPLVLALGLGLGGQVEGVIEGFGILSMASACPILAVLVSGLISKRRSRNILAAQGGTNESH
ncbi:DUF1538 family protein [bacterium]|nr:DUF1538 family protein [bacterium]MBR6244161.1 DUF1538 family protein [bacterium]